MSQYIEADDFIHGVRMVPRSAHRHPQVEDRPTVSAVSTGMDEFVQYCASAGPSQTEWRTDLGKEFSEQAQISKQQFQDLAGVPRKAMQFSITDELTQALAKGIAADVDQEILRALITTIGKNKG